MITHIPIRKGLAPLILTGETLVDSEPSEEFPPQDSDDTFEDEVEQEGREELEKQANVRTAIQILDQRSQFVLLCSLGMTILQIKFG